MKSFYIEIIINDWNLALIYDKTVKNLKAGSYPRIFANIKFTSKLANSFNYIVYVDS